MLQAQVKTVLRELRPNGWGMALAFGTLNPLPGGLADGRTSPYGYLPVSMSLLDDRWVAHANLGITRVDAPRRRGAATWGLGVEGSFAPRLLGVAEVFGQQGERTQVQAGLRFWVVPERMQIDAAIGREGGVAGAGNWLSIGVRLLSPPFLP